MIIPLDQIKGINPEDYFTPEEPQPQNLVPVRLAPSKMQENLSPTEEFGRGLGRGWEQVKGLGAGVVGMAGAATGIDGLEEWGYNKAQEKMQAAATPELEGGVGSIFNVESASDFVNYAAGVMGEQAPNLALSLMGGGLGGAVGKRAVSAAVTEALEAKTLELVAGGLTRKIATERAKLELMEGLGQSMTANLAAEKAAQLAAMKTGVGVGGAAMGVGMEMSSIYNETRDLGLAVKYGVPAGLIEGVADRYFGGKILDALNPATEVGAQVAKAGFGKTLGRAAAGVGMGALIEGPLEEVPQTRLEQMARAEADPNYDKNSDASMRELVEAGAAGAVMGSGMAGGIEATKFALAPLTMKAQSNPEGLPDGTTPAPLTPEEQAKKDAADLEGLYNFDPNPVVIDDGDGEIVARGFNIGGKKGWALENPTDEQRALFPSIPGDRVAITAKSQYGGQLMHVLNQGGRIRRTDNSITDPSILGSKVENEDEWTGYDPNVQNNDLSGEQTGKNTKLDGELAMTEGGQKLALENAVLAPYKELRNVFNAVDMLDSTFDPEIQASLLQDAVTPEEIEVAKSQLATAIAGAKTEEEINILGELEQKISDFESTRTLKQAMVPKSGTPTTPFFERDAEGNLNRIQRDTNADSERPTKVKMWADTVEQNAKAQADLDAARKLKANFDTGEGEGGVFTVRAFDADKVVQNTLGDFSSGRSDFRSDYFDGLETYEMMQADRADLQKKLKASKDPEVTKELTAKLAELEDAATSLNENLSRNDLFSRTVNSKIAEAEGAEKNKAKLEQLRTLEAELQNLQSSRNDLITDEEISDFDASGRGMKLAALPFEVSSIRNSLISPKARAEIYKKAQAEVAAKRDEVTATREAEKAPREFVNAEEQDAAARAEQYATLVYYTDPKTKFRVYGKLIADPETGKATNAAGNFLLLPDTDGFKKGTTGLSDLSDTRQYGAETVELTPSQMANVALDKNKLMALEEARRAKDLGVEDTENKTPIQNATAAAQKQNELNKIQEDQRDNGLVPVDVVKLKRGDRIGLKFPNQEKVARTIYLNDGTQLVPTSAGIFSGTQTVNGERQAVFNRYYIARPKNAKGPSYLNSVTIPNLKKGESLITLNDISEEDKAAEGLKKNEAGVWQTGENVNEDLWGNFYKAPASATFASTVVEKKGGVAMPPLTTGRQGTNLKIKVGDKFQAESLVSDLTDAEQILTLLLGKLSPNPTTEELLAIGLDPIDEVAELESPSGKLEVAKMFNSEIDDTISKSGLKIPVKVGLFSDKKNPNAPLQVRMFAAFDPSLVLEAMQNLQDKNNAPKSPQKEGNIAIAKKALDNEIQDLKRLTLAQMNMGLDVRVKEVNGIPETQMLEGLGFTASRSNAGIKKNDFGKHIITRMEYSPNADYVGSERVYTRAVQTVGKSQRQAAESLRDETAGGKGFNRQKAGLGVANQALENFRRMQLERAQDAKEREAQAIQKGSDLTTRHGEALAGLTAFTRPIFEKYVGPIRAHILDSENSIELKDRWQMESELRLARELNKVQRAALPLSVSEELERQRKTIEANANKLEPVRGKKRIRKKGKQFGELKDDPYQSKRQFERLHREWKQDLEQELANVDAKFFRQMLPRALRGKSGVAEMNRASKEMSELEESLRKGISGMTVSVAADPEEVKAAVAKDKTIARLTKDFNAAAGKGAKERVKLKIEARKSAIEQSAVKERPLSKQEIEAELNKQLKESSAYAQLNRKLEKMGELDSKQSAILDKFLDYVETKGAKLKDESIKAATERIRTLLGRQKESRAGGRQMYVDVRKETEKAESASAKREAKNEGADAESLISENDFTAIQDEEVGNAIKAMDYAAFTENDDLFEGAANAYAALLDKKKQSYTQADKELIKAFGRIMDRVKALNIFGFGRVPGIVKQGFVEASKFKGAIEKQTFVDPQTGEAAGMDSALMGDIIKGQADPLANVRMPEERPKGEEAKSQYLKDLAYRKLDQLARVKLNGFESEVDQNLVELAFVKLFGGEFNGEVDGVEINKTFEPLDKKYTDVLNDFFAGTTANAEKENIARIEKARRKPISDKDRQELTKESRKIAGTANNILDKYLFDISPKQVSLGVPGAPLASLAQASPDIAQSNRDATALPNRAPVNQISREQVQTFVQAYAGLSDSDMVALDDREIGAIYQAATSKADADMAVGAMDAVVAALPSIQQLENMTGGQLMSAYMADVKFQNDRGIAEKVLQDNLKNAANAKMFRSNTAFLEHVASMPKGINRATALRAKEFLKLNDKGSFNWNKIGTQIASFGKNGKQVNWAGVTGKDSTFKGGLAMYLNLDAVHDGNIVQTMLEEMDHVLTHQIINAEEYGITLNPTQASALERLQVAYKKAVLKAGEGMSDLAQAAEGLTPEQKVKFYAEGLLSKASENPEQFRAYYNLTNLDEFVVGVKKDPAFLDLLKELGFNEKVDGGFSLSKFLKDIFHALAELVTGRRLDPASELARVFADSWTLSTGRDAKQFTVSPTQLSMALGIEGSGDTASTKKTGRTENVRMRQGNDGAIYNLSLVKEDDGSWSVAYEHGTPPRKLQQGKKNKTSLNYEQAKNMFDKTVVAKAKKYTIVPDKGPDGGGSTTTTPTPVTPAPAPESLKGVPNRAQVSKLLTGSTESATYTGTKVKTGGWFASDAKAPNGVDAIYDRSVDRKALGEERAQYMATALKAALRRFEKAGTPVNVADVQTALGTIENPLTEDQFAEVNELMLTNREEDAAVLKSEYMKENLADFRARQAAASARLPESIAQIVGELRDVIDPMSRYVDETMGFSVKENEGVYLNRTYLNFADEKTRAIHQKNVRENTKVMEDLKNYVSRQLADREAGLLVRAATRRGEILSREEAAKIAQAGLTESDLAAGMEQYLNYGGDGIGRVFMSGKIPGQKNLKILDSRGNVAPELQAAWGVVKDPVVNYVNTTMKLSAMVANDKFLRELKDVGMESGMLYDPRDPANLSESDAQIIKDARVAALAADPFLASNSRFKPELLDRAMVAQNREVKSILERSEAQIPAGYVKLSADTNKSLAPISGMYAEANFAKWMFEKFPAKGEDPLWLQGLLKATFLPMAMKTVGSVSGHFRNYYAGYMSLVAAGNFNPLDAQWRKDVAEAHALTFGRMLDSASDADRRKAMMKARAELGELGLLGQSVMQNFMGDLAKFDSTSESGFKNFFRKVTQAYGASDEAFKIIHYFSELGKYQRAFPEMPIEQVKQKAAQIARDVHQTYGDTYAAVKSLKKIPFIAPFISFTSEVIRNSVNLVRLARSEISEGKRTGNRELESIGWGRLRGMVFAGGGTFAVASMFAAMSGVGGDEERDLRRLLPDWQKNSQLLFFGKSNGKINFVDFSFTDPFTYLKKPVIALARSLRSDDDRSFNERLAEGVMGAVSEIAEPFLGDQLFSGALLELKANKDSSGRSIYNPQDSAASIAANITGHVAKIFTPGTLDTAGRLFKAANGVVSDSGRSYELGNEVLSAAGVRLSEMDVRQSLGFKAKRFMQDYRDASSLFTGAFLSRGTRSGDDVTSGYNKANDAIRELSEDFRQTYIGAMRLGVPQREVISALKANGISDETIKMLQTGKIKPYEASKQAIKKAQESGAKARIDAYSKAYAATKKY